MTSNMRSVPDPNVYCIYHLPYACESTEQTAMVRYISELL